MTGNSREKVRAVFLAFLMVMSVFGMTMGLAGSAAAAASGGDLSPTLVQPGDEVTVTGNNGTAEEVWIVADIGGSSGQFDEGTDEKVRVPEGDIDAEAGTFETTLTTSDLGLEDGDSVDIWIHQPEPTDTDGLDNNAGTLTVDGTAPDVTVSQADPEDGGLVSDTQQTITVPVSDDVTANDSLFITVDVNNNGKINTYEINPDSDGSDGVDLVDTGGSAGVDSVQITPGSGDVPELEDGTVEVTVTAEDEAGNSGSGSFSFDVDTSPVSSAFTGPSITNDVNATFTVEVMGGESDIDNSTVELDINSGSTTLDYTDAEYDNDSNTFTVNSDAIDADNVPDFADGTVEVRVTAQDDAGNTLNKGDGDQPYTFEVDTGSPSATDTVISDADINNADVAANDVDVEVSFNESVAPSTVQAEVLVDNETVETLDNFQNESGDLSTATAALDLNAAGYQGVENDSAVINVTSAQDFAGNELDNPDAGASETTFAIDTDGPSVQLGTVPDELSGYVNVSSFVGSTDDVAQKHVYLKPGHEDLALVNVTDDARDLDTRDLPDGPYSLHVEVQDDSGNVASADAGVRLTNGNNDVTVQDDFFAGTYPHIDGSQEDWSTVDTKFEGVWVSEPFNISTDVFTVANAEPSEVTYYEDGSSVSGDELIFDPNDYGYYENVTLQAVAPNGDTQKVNVTVNRLRVATGLVTDDIENVSYDNSPTFDNQNPSTILVESSFELEQLDATIQNTDSHQNAQSVSLSIEDFTVADETAGGVHLYAVEVPSELRDGQFRFSVDEVASASQSKQPGPGHWETFHLDYGLPTVTDAHVIDGGQNKLVVQVEFDEPVTNIGPGDVSLEDDRASVNYVGNTGHQGYVAVEFDAEFQTGDEPQIEVTDYNELIDVGGLSHVNSDTTDEAQRTATVHTIKLNLQEGPNVVSVPFEAGFVDLNQVNFGDEIEGIFAYDDGEWSSYVPGQSENTLESMKGGQGYIVVASEDTELHVSGANVPSVGAGVPASETIEHGWNLIGHYQEGDQPATASGGLSTIDNNGDIVTVVEADSNYNYHETNVLEAGTGYWTFVTHRMNDKAPVYAPVDYSDQPATSGVSVNSVSLPAGPVENGDQVTITADVYSDDLQSVVAHAPDLGIDGEIYMDHVGGTTFSATVTVGDDSNVEDDTTANVGVIATNNDGQQDVNSDTIDVAVPPTMESATTVDRDDDGNVDAVTLTYSDSIQDSTVEAADYTIGGTAASGFDTGASADDDTIELQLALDTDEISGTDVTPTVDYQSDRSGGSKTADDDGNLMGDHSIEADDGASPAITSATTGDSDGNGQIDQITLTYSEGVTGLEASDYSVNGYSLTGMSGTGDGDNTATLDLSESGTADTDATPDVSYTEDGSSPVTADATGNEMADQTVTPSDGASPALIDAEVDNNDATVLTGTFSEGVSLASDGSELTSTELTLVDSSGDGSDPSITTVTHTSGNADATIDLDGSGYETGQDEIRLDADVTDDSGNTLSSGATTVIDDDDTV